MIDKPHCKIAVHSDYLPVFEEIIRDTLLLFSGQYGVELVFVSRDTDVDLLIQHDRQGVRVDMAKGASREENFYPLPLRIGQIVQKVLYYAYKRYSSGGAQSFALGRYVFDPDIGVLVSSSDSDNADKTVKLTEKECDILVYLLHCEGESVPRDVLLKEIWQYAEGVDTHTLETHIYRLRQKLEDSPAQPRVLMTDDVGYYLSL